MSDLSAVRAALADLKTEVGAIGTRMDENFQALLAAQAGGDQAAVDAVAAEIRSDVEALKAIETRDTPTA